MTRPTRRAKLYTLALAGVLIAAAGGLVAYSPTLYRMFCAATGYGGTVQRAIAPTAAADETGERITVAFDSNVAPGLDWEFRPEQRKVETRIGEPTQVYYYAKNKSNETIVARATYNVVPFSIAPYFFKIQCFCFTKEKLRPGESARMPIVFYVDKQMLDDPDTSHLRQVTLSYTFFRQKDLSPAEIAATRDLGTGSSALDETLKADAQAGFDNDAPRQ